MGRVSRGKQEEEEQEVKDHRTFPRPIPSLLPLFLPSFFTLPQPTQSPLTS